MNITLTIFWSTIVAVTADYREPLTNDGTGVLYEYAPTIVEAAEYHEIDPFILAALIYEESRWTPDAVSRSNACGLTQVLPQYSGGFTCNDLKNPEISIWKGADILSTWLKRRRKPLKVALACYNAGNVCAGSKSAVKYSNRIQTMAKRYRRAFVKNLENWTKQCINPRADVISIIGV